MTFLLTGQGRPFTADGFGGWFRGRCNETGLLQCSVHGLRKAGAVIAGATAHQLMSSFGWLTLKQAEHYTKAAEHKRMAKDAMRHLIRNRTKTESDSPAASDTSALNPLKRIDDFSGWCPGEDLH